MTIVHNLGFPSIGHRRELKSALEQYWQGESSLEALETVARDLRAKHWQLQKEAGMDKVPVGDFSFYDRMLDTICMVNAIPKRFGFSGKIGLKEYFVMSRGDATHTALEMTKWFDTNYHYIVPEFTKEMTFEARPEALLAQLDEALALKIPVKPVLIGPLTFLYLGKEKTEGFDRLTLLDALLPVYQEILTQLKAKGVEWVQIEEPALVLDLPAAWLNRLSDAYSALKPHAPKILLTTYFDSVEKIAPQLKKLSVDGFHLDLVRAPEQLEAFLKEYPQDKVLSLGIVDGRNIWRTPLSEKLSLLEKVHTQLKDHLWIAPSCSLLHSPVDLAQETKLDEQLKSWLAFGVQKLHELSVLKKGLDQGKSAIQSELATSDKAFEDRRTSTRIHHPAVKERMAKLSQTSDQRHLSFEKRQMLQKERFHLPLFPTTTIGSFPQTHEIRQARADFRKSKISQAEYEHAMKAEISSVIQKQEEMGLDVLVHGEAERNDMVEYFGEQLQGFAFTQFAWVQSYGSRCVKPPIIYGDVYRSKPMTVDWITYAQSQTKKPVKGMLTGPVTILQWSFCRDDQSRSDTAFQIALAIRDEVVDLEKAGIGMIQIDEPAYREGLPLKRSQWDEYLAWASRAFRISASGVEDKTQIHTHMCYSEFNDILALIAAMDADVITIEASRSELELLKGFAGFKYPNEIGPGVYDVHSPAIPSVESIRQILETALKTIPSQNLWANPDCGLKTRRWEEVEPALKNMVEAAQQLRAKTPKAMAEV